MFRNISSEADARGLAGRTLAPCVVELAFPASCTTFEPGTDELPDPMMLPLEQAQAPGRDWSCLTQEPNPDTDPLVNSPVGAPRLVQSLQLTLLVGGGVPQGVSARGCAVRDVDCTAPVTPSIPANAEGWVYLPLYAGFDGFIEITGSGLMSTMLFYADPLSVEGQLDDSPFSLLDERLLPRLSVATGELQDPALGLLTLRAFDCQHIPARGVVFDIDQDDVLPWYFVGGLPSATGKETDETGLGGFINVAPGIALITTELPGSAIPIATTESVLVRPGWMTGLRFVPAVEQEE